MTFENHGKIAPQERMDVRIQGVMLYLSKPKHSQSSSEHIPHNGVVKIEAKTAQVQLHLYNDYHCLPPISSEDEQM